MFNDAAIVLNELELFVWCSRDIELGQYGERVDSRVGSLKTHSHTAVGSHALSLVNDIQSPLLNDHPGVLDVPQVLRLGSRKLLSSLVGSGLVAPQDDMDSLGKTFARQILPTDGVSDSVLPNEDAWSGPREFFLSRVVLGTVCLVFVSVSPAQEYGEERHSPQENELRANIIKAYAEKVNASQVEEFLWPPFHKLGAAIQTTKHLQMAWNRWWHDVQTDFVLLMLDQTEDIDVDHEQWFAFCKGDVLRMPGLREMLEHPALKQKLLVGFDRFVS